MQTGAQNSVFVNGTLIKEDRGKQDLSQDALANSAGIAFSLSTLRRAESGGPITIEKIGSKARALGREPSRYILKEGGVSEDETVLQLDGDWKAFYVEDDTGVAPYLVTEALAIVQNGVDFRGEYICDTYERPDNFVLIGQINGPVVTGKYFVRNRIDYTGIGVIQLIHSRNSNWFDGCCTWYDYDSGKIEYSRNIWIKMGEFYSEILLNQAKKIMLKEVKIVKIRKDIQKS